MLPLVKVKEPQVYLYLKYLASVSFEALAVGESEFQTAICFVQNKSEVPSPIRKVDKSQVTKQVTNNEYYSCYLNPPSYRRMPVSRSWI